MNTQAFDKTITELKQFYQQHAHTYVPPYAEFQALYQKVAQLRQNKPILSKDAIAQLDEMQFDWTASARQIRWFYNYFQLRAHYQQHDDTQLPFHYPADPRLGAWTHRQRKRKSQLSLKQRGLLDQINFHWEVEPSLPSEERWKIMLSQLQEFYNEHQHSMVPSTYEDSSLAKWVVRQRENRDTLSKDQIEALDRLFFVWDVQYHRVLHWDYMFHQLRLYKDQHGHTRVPSTANNKKLAIWVRAQRTMGKRLSAKKRKKLQEIGFAFQEDMKAQRHERWLRNFHRLEKHYQEHGNLEDITDSKLYQWLYRQTHKDNLEDFQRILLKQINAL